MYSTYTVLSIKFPLKPKLQSVFFGAFSENCQNHGFVGCIVGKYMDD